MTALPSTNRPQQLQAIRAVAPAKSILKNTSKVLGKRKVTDDAHPDSDAMDAPESPRKRPKVEFEASPTVFEIDNRPVEEVKTEIRRALEAHSRGDDEDYDNLKDIFSGNKGEDDNDVEDVNARSRDDLKNIVLALTSFAPHLGRACNGLVKSVLQCQWVGRDDEFARVYTQFLAALVSAQGSYLGQVIAMIVKKFSDSRQSSWRVDGFPTVNRETMQERLHVALKYLLQIFPAASPVVLSQITKSFPYHDESKRVHLAYVDNLLRLRKYSPEMASDILDVIVDRVVKIDVQMQMDLEDLDDELTAMVALALRNSQAAVPQDDEDDSDVESVSSDEDDDDELAQVKATKDSIEKMDSILDSLFGLYAPRFISPDSDEAKAAFDDILSQFSNIILPTYKSRYTQFLVFHFGQRSEHLMDAFCGTCINIAFESQRPLVLRQAAAAYLASFVSRGVHVPGNMVRAIFEVLGYHLDQMRLQYEPTCRGPDIRRYASFYSLTQALLYIFCFRWQDLVRSVPDDVDRDDPSSYLGQEIDWDPDIKEILRRNIFCKLNPLKVCSPGIVEQYALLAHRLRFMYVYTLLEANKRVRLSQFIAGAYSNGGALRDSGLDLADESWQQLDSYFPFDPYQLPASKHWVDSDYLHWRTIPGLSQDEEEGDSEEEDELDDEVEEEDTATDEETGGDD